MRLRATLLLALGTVICLVFWSTGGFATLGWWLAGRQRALQDALAGEIAALRDGQGAALWGLIGLCAAYGFLHALGPGHGKALIAGAAVGTRATVRRMALIALAGSLAQAGAAIVLVYGGLALLDVTARGLVDGAERWGRPLGSLGVGLIGVWILGRGLRALRRSAATATDGQAHEHENGHGHGHEHGPGCGHAHGPSADQAARAAGFGASLALVAGMAARPCTGAIFVLVIAWRMGLAWAGASAVVAMGLGTAAFTALVAWFAVTSREATFLSAGSGAARLLGPGLQIVAGGAILVAAAVTLVAGLAPM